MDAAPESLLREYGYVEQEYYVTGTACRYRIAAPLATAQVVDCGWPYVTRMLVRRPANPAKFNGVAVVEWNNVTTGQDIDFVWSATHDYQMRAGYAEISLSVQQVGVNALKAWSPARYGNVTVSAPNTDPIGGTLDRTGDVLGWDIYSQAIQGLRHPGAVNPLPDMVVKHVIAVGESQSAARLTSYYNSIDPLAHVADGLIFYDAAGQLRTDSPTKAISVATEIGLGLLPSGLPAPDSANYRRWEVAGTSHVSYEDIQYVDPMVLRDGFLKTPDGQASTLTGLITGCSRSPAWSTVPTGYVIDSAIDHVSKWIKEGTPPPAAPLLVRDFSAPPIRPGVPAYAKDANGLTLGGIQLTQYDSSAAINEGSGTTGPGFCFLTGMHQFYTDQQLAARYPDPQAYLTAARQLTAHNLAAGFILPSDAVQTIHYADTVYRRLLRIQAGTHTAAVS